MAYCTSEMSKMLSPRMASRMSSIVYRSFSSSFRSITPSEMIILGEPVMMFRSFGLFSVITDMSTSMHTIISIGTIPMSMGMVGSSIESVATFDTSIVVTSSLGWSSPSCFFPMSRISSIITVYSITVLIIIMSIPSPL